MGGLSADIARLAVAELFIKKLGEKLEIGPLADFDKDSPASPRVFYLGLNRITDLLHWVFVNKYYKISSFEQLPDRVQKKLRKIRGRSKRKLVEREDVIELLRQTSEDVFAVDPTRFLESPRDPQSYPTRYDERTGKHVEELPEIYTLPKGKEEEIGKLEAKKRYQSRLGLSMLAFSEGKAYFSPYAILDPRSCEAGYWDVILGIETTIYLPVEMDGRPIGVLTISQDFENAKLPGWSGHEFLKSPSDRIDIDEDTLRVRKQYSYMTDEIAGDCQEIIQKRWESVKVTVA